MKPLLLLLSGMLFCLNCLAQDSLVLITGQRIAYTKIDLEPDRIRIKTHEGRERMSFNPDSVMGFCSPANELNYYLKPYEEAKNGLSYQFLERVEVGHITLYRKTDTPGQPEYNYGNTLLYMEKEGEFKCVFDAKAGGGKKLLKRDAFTEFIEDDEESLSYIQGPGFKFRAEEVIKVVQYYNRRNFIPRDPRRGDVFGKIILYRTKFAKPKSPVTVNLFGKRHKLYINDFIQLDFPITYAAKVSVKADYVQNYQLLAGDFTDQYFEVVYDKKSNTFQFDRKEGTEVQYEFYKIKKKVVGN